MEKLSLYTVFHGNLNYSSIPREAYHDIIDLCYWPILNAMLSVGGGSSWTSVHHGGGVGLGYSIHSGVVIVADGSVEMKERLNRVLTNDPGTGVMRHADAGYEKAINIAEERNLKLPMINMF